MDIRFNREDAAQVIIGSFALSVPIAFTQEAWKLGESLPAANLVIMICISLLFLSLYSFHGVFSGKISRRFLEFGARILTGYLLALAVVGIVLIALDRLPLFAEPVIALKRVLIIGMPASMGAIIVDSFDKESWTD